MKHLNRSAYLVRNQLIKGIRTFFEAKNFTEVVAPVFNSALPLEPNLYSFKTQWQTVSGEQPLYLSISPEAGLKKMMAAGLGNCFALGKCFRNLENSGSQHNPEFLMLEWYRSQATYTEIMAETRELILSVLGRIAESPTLSVRRQQLDVSREWHQVSLDDLWQQQFGVSLAQLEEPQALSKLAQQRDYAVEDSTWEQLFNQLFLNEIEPTFSKQPFFLIDFPARLSPLCQPKKGQPHLAERFELYIGGWEIGNGNTENLDTDSIKQHFQEEATARQQAHQPVHPLDQDFLTAIETLQKTGMTYAGIGLGIDRLAMLLAGVDSIGEVEYFTQTVDAPSS